MCHRSSPVSSVNSSSLTGTHHCKLRVPACGLVITIVPLQVYLYAWPSLRASADHIGTNISAPAKTTRPAVIPTGQAANCNRWYQATGYETCDDIVLLFGTFDSSSFISWNPSVGSGCSTIKADTNYCIGVPGTATSRNSTSSASFPSSAPTQSGVAANCSDFWQVSR